MLQSERAPAASCPQGPIAPAIQGGSEICRVEVSVSEIKHKMPGSFGSPRHFECSWLVCQTLFGAGNE